MYFRDNTGIFFSSITTVPVSYLKNDSNSLISSIHSVVEFLINFDSGSK